MQVHGQPFHRRHGKVARYIQKWRELFWLESWEIWQQWPVTKWSRQQPKWLQYINVWPGGRHRKFVIETPEVAQKSYNFYDIPTSPTWTSVREDAVPWCFHKRRTGYEIRSQRGPCTGTATFDFLCLKKKRQKKIRSPVTYT